MALDVGTRLGVFEISGMLGKGGMGEVYRARDTKLQREVAIKILPEIFALDAERLARFEREARVLATLDHPNIGALYDLQESDGIRFLVMQLIEGETLADLIARGPLAISELLPLFAQIAEGLEAAHDSGIVHRDLKPSNIAIGNDGRVKVLDFGLATSVEPRITSGLSPSDATKPADSPPEAKVTTDGAVLGTPSYMSPEQARGKPIDKRTDIWAFGCCLFEGLTGKIPFDRETAADTLAAVLESEPDWDLLPKDTPWKIRELLERCLEKDARYRLRDIGDAWTQIKILTTESGRMTPAARETAVPRRRGRMSVVSIALISILVGAAGAWAAFSILAELEKEIVDVAMEAPSQPKPQPVKRFDISIGRVESFMGQGRRLAAEVAISDDGNRLAYVADLDGTRRLYVRDLDKTEPIVLSGTEGARMLFFSPDGEWIGFQVITGINQGKLMKVLAAGGTAQEICDSFPPMGGIWLEDDTIVFTGQDGDLPLHLDSWLAHLFRIPSSGGFPERFTKADGLGRGEWTHNYPARMAGLNAFLFSIAPSPADNDIALYNLDTGTYETIIKNARAASYSATGHILFVRDQSIWAVPFDSESMSIGGAEILMQRIAATPVTSMPYAVSLDGSLFYVPETQAREVKRALVWVDHEGREKMLLLEDRPYYKPKVSPDGTRIVFPLEDPDNWDLWIHDRSLPDSLIRLTFDPARDEQPIWSADGTKVFFGAERDGEYGVQVKRADGAGRVERLRGDSGNQAPIAASPDGKTLLVGVRTPETDFDIGSISLEGDPNEHLIIHTKLGEGNPAFSPDGKWIVYSAGEAQTLGGHVWVQPYPNVDDGRWQISTDPGNEPRWAPDGSEIYYRSGGKMMAVSVETSPTFRADTPRPLFDDVYYRSIDQGTQYDLEYPLGKRFLMIKEIEDTTTTNLVYVENWSEELKRLAPPYESVR